jgi:hypothetical protein
VTDIVERLRSPEVFIATGGMNSPVAPLAADEIERLRAEMAQLRAVDRQLRKMLGDAVKWLRLSGLSASVIEPYARAAKDATP